MFESELIFELAIKRLETPHKICLFYAYQKKEYYQQHNNYAPSKFLFVVY